MGHDGDMTTTRTGIDTRTLRVGDVIAWHIWTGEETTAKIMHVGQFSYSRESADGYSESVDHHIAPNYRIVSRSNVIALPGVEASFLDGRRTYTTDPNRTDAVQVAMFDAANVDEPALFDGLFA